MLCGGGLVKMHVCGCSHVSWALRAPSCVQAAFGPFYRITQLILTTTPAANSTQTTPSGLPAIVTGAGEGS